VRSANRCPVAVPRFRLNTNGHRALSVTGPMAWNSLPDFIRNPTSSTDCFRRLLKRTYSRDTNASLTLMSYKSTQSHRHAHHNTTAPSLPEVKLQKAMFKNTYFTFFSGLKKCFLVFIQRTFRNTYKVVSETLLINPSKWVLNFALVLHFLPSASLCLFYCYR